MASTSYEHKSVPLDGSRRSFIGVLLGLASAFVGALLSVPVLRYIFYPLTAKSNDSGWAEVGPASSFSNVQTPLRRTLDLKQTEGWRETVSQPVVYIVQTRRSGEGPVGYLSPSRLYCPLGSGSKRICMSMPWWNFLRKRHEHLRTAAPPARFSRNQDFRREVDGEVPIFSSRCAQLK